MLRHITLRRSIWLAAVALAIHEIEEWNIAPWFSEHFHNAPGIQRSEVWVGLGLVSVVALLWAWAATRARSDVLCAAAALPLVIGVGAGNALQHLTWLFLFGAYAPGVVTASVLVLPAALLFAIRIPRTPALLAACATLFAIVLFGSVATYRAGPRLQTHEVAFQQQIILLARSLGL